MALNRKVLQSKVNKGDNQISKWIAIGNEEL